MEPKHTGGRHERRRGEEFTGPTGDFDELQASDDFLTALSRGIDPSDGSDELASLLLQLRDDVEAEMPAAPDVIGDAPTEETPVISLADRRERRNASRGGRHKLEAQPREKRFRTNPWMAGLVGAAAATVMVAGTGAALYSATPGSALYGPSEALFGERTDVVELAGALDEIDDKTQSGDITGARVLIEQLRDSLKAAPERAQRQDQGRERGVAPAPAGTATVTVTQAPPKDGEKPAAEQKPATVTVTPEPITQTVTVTEAPQSSGGASGEPSSSARATSSASTVPTTTKILGETQPDSQSSQ